MEIQSIAGCRSSRTRSTWKVEGEGGGEDWLGPAAGTVILLHCLEGLGRVTNVKAHILS